MEMLFGSSLAMKLMVKELGKQADVIIPEYSKMYEFLPLENEIKSESEIEKYDLAISVDCATLKRLAKRWILWECKENDSYRPPWK